MNHILGLSIASSTSLHPGPREHRAGPCLCEHPSDLLLQSKCLQSAFGRAKLLGTARGVQEQRGITCELHRPRGMQSTRSPGSLSHAWPGNTLSLWGGDCRELGAGVDEICFALLHKTPGAQQLVTALYNAGKRAVVRADTGAAGGWRAGKWYGPRECGLAVEGGARFSCSLCSCTSTMNRHRRQRLCCRNQYRSRSGRGAPPCTPGGAIPQRLTHSYRCNLLSSTALLSSPLSRAAQQQGVTAPGLGSLLTWTDWLLLEVGGIQRRGLL